MEQKHIKSCYSSGKFLSNYNSDEANNLELELNVVTCDIYVISISFIIKELIEDKKKNHRNSSGLKVKRATNQEEYICGVYNDAMN